MGKEFLHISISLYKQYSHTLICGKRLCPVKSFTGLFKRRKYEKKK